MSAHTARQTGLVSEVVPAESLLQVSHDLACRIAASPPISVQATLRTLWAARSLSSDQALALGNVFLQLGNARRALREGQEDVRRGASRASGSSANRSAQPLAAA